MVANEKLLRAVCPFAETALNGSFAEATSKKLEFDDSKFPDWKMMRLFFDLLLFPHNPDVTIPSLSYRCSDLLEAEIEGVFAKCDEFACPQVMNLFAQVLDIDAAKAHSIVVAESCIKRFSVKHEWSSKALAALVCKFQGNGCILTYNRHPRPGYHKPTETQARDLRPITLEGMMIQLKHQI